MKWNYQQKITMLSKHWSVTKVIPNNGCEEKLVKFIELNLLVYADVQTVQEACFLTMNRTNTKALTIKAYALIH